MGSLFCVIVFIIHYNVFVFCGGSQIRVMLVFFFSMFLGKGGGGGVLEVVVVFVLLLLLFVLYGYFVFV